MVRPLPLKFAIVGDKGVGKTSLLITFAKEKFPDELALNSLETLAKVVSVGQQKYSVTIVDTYGSSTHDRIRPLSYYYPPVDVFLICYDVSDRSSFENISSKWILETHKHCPKAKIFVVGTKLDKKAETSVSETEGQQLKNLLNASGFARVSSQNGENVTDLFTEAVKIAKVKYSNSKQA